MTSNDNQFLQKSFMILDYYIHRNVLTSVVTFEQRLDILTDYVHGLTEANLKATRIGVQCLVG